LLAKSWVYFQPPQTGLSEERAHVESATEPNANHFFCKVRFFYFLFFIFYFYFYFLNKCHRCEWVFGLRVSFYGWIPSNSSWGDINADPRCVFVRSDLLQLFHDRILPCLPKSRSFVIITGDADSTTPRQVDPRYGEPLSRKTWNSLLEDGRVKHVFVEHLDENVGHPKVSPFPVGLNPSEVS
jgi:hypothetical protein